MKVLAIGNSFSQDAMRYLHRVAKSEGVNMKTVNLYIGGCPLSKHFVNMNNDSADYDFEFNGEGTGIRVSIREALQSDIWDVVTLQQVSHQSFDYNTYQPYLDELTEYVKYHAPKAELMFHRTWAYEEGSERLTKELGFSNHTDMFSGIKKASELAAADMGGAKIIPAGDALEELLKTGVEKVHRDTFHASLGLGRYTIALTWYEMLTGKSCLDNSFREFDVPLTEEEIKLARLCANAAVKKCL